jgi:hypothetical protein
MSRRWSALALLFAAPAVAAPPEVTSLRRSKAGDITYFTVAFKLPGNLALRVDREPGELPSDGLRHFYGRLPRLVPQDGRSRAVSHLWLNPGHDHPLAFVGQVGSGDGPARFVLFYPTERQLTADEAKKSSLVPHLAVEGWAEERITLDFSKAEVLDAPLGRPKRTYFPAMKDDLEGLWAAAQARDLALLQAVTPDSGFYSFAIEATRRKYSIPDMRIPRAERIAREQEPQRLYEMTTGAAAVAESLALKRMRDSTPEKLGNRTIPIERVTGITIGEHPWEKMMAGKRPAHESPAELVPHDQYYIAFKNFRAFLELGELLDQWGTNALRAFHGESHDHQLKQRYEKQLCLGSSALGKTLGPALIHGVAITGSDVYFREGTDVTLIFHVVNRELFLASVDPFIQRARTEYRDQLRETRSTDRNVAIESFVTPYREVSLHRASVGDFVVYSNSGTALRRILDTRAGDRTSLAQSNDFRYMRTVFHRDDKAEDGFAFLSDAFIRQLVGPASKIKEKRRLEALTSLHLVTHGALFTAWETGELPKSHKALLAASGLTAEKITVPAGTGVTWDSGSKLAVSEAYNTIQFTTPLIELPIDNVTEREKAEYDAFREDYMRLWRRYFDPVGFRVSLNEKQVKVETYILPLVNNSAYNELRQATGNGTAKIDLADVSPKTLFQYFVHWDPQQNLQLGKAVGEWVTLRWDDGPQYRQMLAYLVRREMGEVTETAFRSREARLFLELPFSLGVKIGDEKAFDQLIQFLEVILPQYLGPCDRTSERYRGTMITVFRFERGSEFAKEVNRQLGLEVAPAEQKILPVLVHAKIGGVWYVGFNEKVMRDQIDVIEGRKGAERPKRDRPVINSSVYIAPDAAVEARSALRAYLEWETHRRAVANTTLWHALYRSGVLAPDADDKTMRAAAQQWFGFVPVSPDDSEYVFDRTGAEVVNARHGSLHRPRLNDDLAAKAPLATLLDQVRTIRADLRFREDGVHTTLTLERK